MKPKKQVRLRWSAPIPSWVFGVRDRLGRRIGDVNAHLLSYLWTRADAPSKREPGPAFLRPCWRVSIPDMAKDLDINQRTIERRFSSLISAGVVMRGQHSIDGSVEDGIWLADVEIGYFTPKSVGRAPPKVSAGYRQKCRPGTAKSVGRIKEARSIPEQARSIPDQKRTKMARPTKQDAKQETLFDEEPAAQESALRDPAFEVFEYLAQRLYCTKRDLKLPTQGLRVLGKKSRKLIQAMIDAYSYELDECGKRTGRVDVELGIAACRQVIEVDEADARRTGNFTWWDADTPFRPDNFGSRLGRWRPDGKHAAFGVVENRTPKVGSSSGRGWADPEFTERIYGKPEAKGGTP